jgi:hypothetical protein
MTADKRTELQSVVYVALMNGNSDPSRFPISPGTSSDRRSARVRVRTVLPFQQ